VWKRDKGEIDTRSMIEAAKETMLSVLPDGASGSEHCRSLCFWIDFMDASTDWISSAFL
jgi:hypothetical protein